MNDLRKYGVGAALSILGGNEDSVKAFQAAIDKEIASVALGADDQLHFVFIDGTKLKMYDDGQSCCESRYMRTDDDLNYYVGSKLLSAEVKDADNIPDEYGDHEVQFLVVTTSKGTFSLSSHNEHNGYYGGISIRAMTE